MPLSTTEPESAISLLYKPESFDALYNMPGFSEKLLSTHFKLYEGYVSNTNAWMEKIPQLLKNGDSLAYAEAKRRFGWEFNGMRLHEYYFKNLGGDGKQPDMGSFQENIIKQFGGFQNWKEDFLATGAMRGVGWAILYEDPMTGKLINSWIEQHHINHLAGARPLLVMDVFEHAYISDYGLEKKKYMEAFFANIKWDVVIERYMRTASNLV
jgi:superoxide dismutase, Fe-Mn family